jgi:hypothetical protein
MKHTILRFDIRSQAREKLVGFGRQFMGKPEQEQGNGRNSTAVPNDKPSVIESVIIPA